MGLQWCDISFLVDGVWIISYGHRDVWKFPRLQLQLVFGPCNQQHMVQECLGTPPWFQHQGYIWRGPPVTSHTGRVLLPNRSFLSPLYWRWPSIFECILSTQAHDPRLMHCILWWLNYKYWLLVHDMWPLQPSQTSTPVPNLPGPFPMEGSLEVNQFPFLHLPFAIGKLRGYPSQVS